jgi:dTDP-4-amino-4,6-dideoxygalactose transaminase
MINPFTNSRPKISPRNNQLVCLSVRTGFDLVLSALNFPPGTEILVTDINIPDMFNIIAGHNLVPIPLKVDKQTLHISAAEVKNAITSSTKAILITHLFGGIMDMDDIVDIAREYNLHIFEDCAQAYAGNVYDGHPASAAVMFSFGFIKTNTALSGAVIRINNPALYADTAIRNNRLIQQNTATYFKKLCKAFFIKLLTGKIIYTIFYKLVMMAGKDFEKVIRSFTKGFPGEDIFVQIRYRPSTPNVKLLEKKITNFRQQYIVDRIQFATDILTNIPGHYRIGWLNNTHTHWILPIETTAPTKLIRFLQSNGFDASQKASSLIKLNHPGAPPDPAALELHNLVYLPLDPGMKYKTRMKLARLLTSFQP